MANFNFISISTMRSNFKDLWPYLKIKKYKTDYCSTCFVFKENIKNLTT